MVTSRPDILRRLTAHARTGWYLRVLQPGAVPAAGPIRVVERHPAAVTVLDTHRSALPDARRAEIERVAACEALAARWRESILAALARA